MGQQKSSMVTIVDASRADESGQVGCGPGAAAPGRPQKSHSLEPGCPTLTVESPYMWTWFVLSEYNE
jgi:hypothetical protein